jgi:hypothetical protein
MLIVSFIVGNLFWSNEKSPISACQNSLSNTWPGHTTRTSNYISIMNIKFFLTKSEHFS